MLSRILQKFSRCDRGSALVETAIVVPVAIALFAGGIELSRGIFYNHAAEKSVRDVARYMARLPAAQAGDSALAKQWVSSELEKTPTNVVVTVDAARLAAGFVRINGQITYQLSLLSLVWSSPAITFQVAHEEPYIGS